MRLLFCLLITFGIVIIYESTECSCNAYFCCTLLCMLVSAATNASNILYSSFYVTHSNNMCVSAPKKIVHGVTSESTSLQLSTVRMIIYTDLHSRSKQLFNTINSMCGRLRTQRSSLVIRMYMLIRVLSFTYIIEHMPAITNVYVSNLLRWILRLRVRTYIRTQLNKVLKYEKQSANEAGTAQKHRLSTNPMHNDKHAPNRYTARSQRHNSVAEVRKMYYTAYERCLFDINGYAYRGNIQYKQVQKRKKHENGQSDFKASKQASNLSVMYNKILVGRRHSQLSGLRNSIHMSIYSNNMRYSSETESKYCSAIVSILSNGSGALYNVDTLQRRSHLLLRYKKCAFRRQCIKRQIIPNIKKHRVKLMKCISNISRYVIRGYSIKHYRRSVHDFHTKLYCKHIVASLQSSVFAIYREKMKIVNSHSLYRSPIITRIARYVKPIARSDYAISLHRQKHTGLHFVSQNKASSVISAVKPVLRLVQAHIRNIAVTRLHSVSLSNSLLRRCSSTLLSRKRYRVTQQLVASLPLTPDRSKRVLRDSENIKNKNHPMFTSRKKLRKNIRYYAQTRRSGQIKWYHV